MDTTRSMAGNSPRLSAVAREDQLPVGSARRSDSVSTTGDYQPLQPGKWSIHLHGNCPRCHHSHDAVEVKVTVARDASQTTYVDCERCKGKWVALNGDNSTQISLLSTTTDIPDPVEEVIREHLVGLIRRSTTQGSLDGSQVHPLMDDVNTSAFTQDDAHISAGLENQIRQVPTLLESIPENETLSRSRSRKILDRVRVTRDTHLPTLHRANLTRWLLRQRQPVAAARRQQIAVARELSSIEPRNTTPGPSQSTIPNGEQSDVPIDRPDGSILDVEPVAQDPRVTGFLSSLDISNLENMNRQAGIAWARRQYTDFQTDIRGSAVPMDFSPIRAVSTTPLRRRSRIQSRRSIEINGIGAVVNGIRLSLPYASIAFESPNNTTHPSYSASARLLRMRRPNSLPVPPRYSPQFAHLSGTRTSVDSLGYRAERSSATSSMGRQSVRLSQASTAGTLPSHSGSAVDLSLMHEAMASERSDEQSFDTLSLHSWASQEIITQAP